MTGLTLAALTVEAYQKAFGAANWSTYSASPALVEIGAGRYELKFNLPAAAGWFDLYVSPVDTTRTVFDAHWSGEVETQDIDSLYANIVKGVALPTVGALLGIPYPAELVAYRYNTWSIPITDSAGAPIDLTAYSTFALSVRSKDQTTKKLDATNGSPTGFVLTGSVSGILTVTWPESLGTVGSAADIYSWLTTGVRENDPLYYEVTGDLGGLATKTVPIIRSSKLTLLPREVGS